MKISKELKIGVSAIVIIALAYWGITFLKGKNLFKAQYSYIAVYDNLTDMKVSSPVFYKGVKIGSVTALNMKDIFSDASVTITLSKKYRLPENSVAVMRDASLLGGKSIDIELGNSPVFLNNGDTIRTAVTGTATEQLGALISGAASVMDTVDVALGRINHLVSDENINNISSTLKDISLISANLNSTVASESANIRAIIDNLSEVSAELKAAMPAVNSAMSNIDTLSGDLKTSLPLTIKKIDDLLASLNEGNGTAGKLLTDDEVYDNLNIALNNLQVLLADLKENPDRYVQISVFGKKNKK